MQRLEVSGAVRPIYGSLGVKRLTYPHRKKSQDVRSGDLGGQGRRCSNLFERPCIMFRYNNSLYGNASAPVKTR